MIIVPSADYSGWYKLEAHKVSKSGKIISSRIVADWFPNIITDVGLNAMGLSNLFDLVACCRVGSGTVPPSVTDTQLQTFIAGTGVLQTSSSAMVAGPPRYAYAQWTRRFAEGAAAGNISEVGMASTVSNTTGILYSRALVVDGAGNPTTITILSDEVLDVSYQLRRYIPSTADVPYSGMIIAGVEYSGVRRPLSIDSADDWVGYANTGSAGGRAYGSILVGNGGLAAITATGLPGSTSSVYPSNLAYSNGSLYRDYTATFGLNQGNLVGGINAIHAMDAYGNYQWSVSPAIPKTASKVLTLTFRCGPWGRYTP